MLNNFNYFMSHIQCENVKLTIRKTVNLPNEKHTVT